jgi:hypothetical protein
MWAFCLGCRNEGSHPGIEISAYSVVTIIVLLSEESGEEACASQLQVNPSLARPDASPIVAMKETRENR